jgi:penicillin-binding protein 1C
MLNNNNNNKINKNKKKNTDDKLTDSSVDNNEYSNVTTRENKEGKRLNRKKKNRKRRLIITGAVLLVLIIWGILYFSSFDASIFDRNGNSTTFYDRNGKPLRTYFSSVETYSRHSGLSEVSPHFMRAIVLIEDKRFYNHGGVEFSSLVRALWQNIKGKRVVSGGSTITMQLAKLVYSHRERTLLNKVSEIFSAWKFEMHLEKSAILEHYINRLPFGNMIYGIQQASQFYFGKEPAQLSLNQAIYLALIPKSPTRYNPGRHRRHLQKRWVTILDIFKQQGHISEDEYRRAKVEGETIRFRMKREPISAPHFIERVKDKLEAGTLPERVHTTLDYRLQKAVEGIVREHLVRLKDYRVGSAAVVVLDNRTHQVTAYMGSPDYLDRGNAGYVDLASALRQPGSTLKPFVYGLALEEGYRASSILPDIRFPTRGGFFPANHDGRYHGPLRLRVALACSYNVPAFYMAMKMTPAQVIRKLNLAGFDSIKGESGFYGETIALGSGEVRLFDLVTAYSALANGGKVYSPVMIQNEPTESRRLFDEGTAFILWDILADPSARFASFGYDSSMNMPFPVAVKTGTSKGYRDRWAVAVNTGYTVGVWIGNPEGKNMKDTSGVANVTAIMRDVFLEVQKDWTRGEVKPPKGVVRVGVCALSGLLPSDACPEVVQEYYLDSNRPNTTCDWHVREGGRLKVNYPELYRKWAAKTSPAGTVRVEPERKQRISHPQQGDFFYISDAVPLGDQQITFEVMGFEPGDVIEYYVDGRLHSRRPFPEFPFWQLKKGDYTLTVKCNSKTVDKISFIVR